MGIKVDKKLFGLMGMLIGIAFFELCFTGSAEANGFPRIYAIQVTSTDTAGKVYQIDSPNPTASMRLLLQWKKSVQMEMRLEHNGVVLARTSGRSPLEVKYRVGSRNLSGAWKVRVKIARSSFRRTVVSGALTTQYNGGLGPAIGPSGSSPSTGNTAPKNTTTCNLAGKWNLHKRGQNSLYWMFKRDSLHDPANHKVNTYRVYEYLHGKGLGTLQGVAQQEKATGIVHVLQNNTAHSPNFPDIRYYRLTIKPGCTRMVFSGEQLKTLIGPVTWSQASLTKVQKKGLFPNTGRSRGRGAQPKGRSNRANSPHWGSPANSMQKSTPTSGQGSGSRMPIQRHALASQPVGVNSSGVKSLPHGISATGVNKKTTPVFSASQSNSSHTLQQRDVEPQVAQDGKESTNATGPFNYRKGVTEWRVKPWQTEAWETEGNNDVPYPPSFPLKPFHADHPWDNGLASAARWIEKGNLAIGNVTQRGANPYTNGTAGTYAITVQTPMGELPCNVQTLRNTPYDLRLGYYYSCMDRFPLNSTNYKQGIEREYRSVEGNIISTTHHYFYYYAPNAKHNVTISIKKISGKSRATVSYVVSGLAHAWNPGSCEFLAGKKNIGKVCTVTIHHVDHREVVGRIDGYNNIRSFGYKITFHQF